MGFLDPKDTRDESVNVFSGVRGLIYLLIAVIAIIPTYKLYTLIKILPNMSTLASITCAIIFWLIAFTVVYIGTERVMQGKTRVAGYREK